MAVSLRDQALPLLAAANNHGDLAVKLSSLRQAKDILLSADPNLASELLPYLVDLQASPESLVRKTLVELIEDVGCQAAENLPILVPVILSGLKDTDAAVVRQSIITGANIFTVLLEQLSSQFYRRGVERWLEELGIWMGKFKDAVFSILFEVGPIGTKLLAIKFLEMYILTFTPDSNNSENLATEALTRDGRAFNISRVASGHPVLDPSALISDAIRCVGILLDMLQSVSSVSGSLTISIVNCLAAIAKKRPNYYSSILSKFLDLSLGIEVGKGIHTASVQYSFRTAFLGFLRCTHSAMVESREKLLRALSAMHAGDAADHVMRQVDKMARNNGRALRDARASKDDQSSIHLPMAVGLVKKRLLSSDNDEHTNRVEGGSKRTRYDSNMDSSAVQINNFGQDSTLNGVFPKAPVLENEMAPVEQMIAVIGALIAEGKRGAESIGILIAKTHPDLLADIVIANMKHLPKYPPPLITEQSGSLSDSSEVVRPVGSAISSHAPISSIQVPLPVSNAACLPLTDGASPFSLPTDSKRDPRRDPRRLDPRRIAGTAGLQSIVTAEENISSVQFEFEAPSNKPLSLPVAMDAENISLTFAHKNQTETNIVEYAFVSGDDQFYTEEEVNLEETVEVGPDLEDRGTSDITLSPDLGQDLASENTVHETSAMPDFSSLPESDQFLPTVSNTAVTEESSAELPVLPSYVELTGDQRREMRNLAVERIIESYKQLKGTDSKQTCMVLLARLIAEIRADDDVVVIMQRSVIPDYQQQKGHELVMHVLYHLYTLATSDSVGHSSFADELYQKFLLAVAKSLLDTLPATDKSFSRLLGEVPFLPDSILKLLDDVCYSHNHRGKDARDGDRVTQILGAVWSLILGRPLSRQACLDVALKCAVHPEDDVRAKAIRLVTNKLYVLSYATENIEKFAVSMFISAVDQHVSDIFPSQSRTRMQTIEREIRSQETSISGSQNSEPAVCESDSLKGEQSDFYVDSLVSVSQAQRLISLFFALCTKKPNLLQLAFNNYGRASKSVKQAIGRHIPILLRALGSSCPELLQMISNPPCGSETLLTQVVQFLSEGTSPSDGLVATVKDLYKTKLKDASILIPILSSFSKNEVLPIFPRLVELPLDKFQMALAHILQGSAHTGPALTPAEVLVAIHDINPEKDGLPLKKITDACSACFEQRTVFTQQVLAKALNQMVNQTPLPLLFMRTVIQAIDAHPTLVDFVMEILSKLVSRQIWRMPKLWVGFLKCVSQTQPHSFHVMLQLPPPQLESALNKYSTLRGPLASYANQPSVKLSVPRSTAAVLGLASESNVRQPHLSPMHASENGSVHDEALT